MREVCYTFGLITKYLISSDDSKDQAADRKDDNLNFAKLILLQGGIENRFIPELSDATKDLMKGYFRLNQE